MPCPVAGEERLPLSKLQSLVLGGVIGALAGILLAIDRQSPVQPDAFLPVPHLRHLHGSRDLGRTRHPALGPIVGSMVYWFVIQFTDRFLRETVEAGWCVGGHVVVRVVIAWRAVRPRRTLLLMVLVALPTSRPPRVQASRRCFASER